MGLRSRFEDRRPRQGTGCGDGEEVGRRQHEERLERHPAEAINPANNLGGLEETRMKKAARIVGGLSCAWGANAAFSQELEPRAYSPAPTGTNFALMAYGHSTGEVLTDPAAPVQNIDAALNIGVAGYGRTFGIAGHQASAVIVAPYVWGDVSG